MVRHIVVFKSGAVRVHWSEPLATMQHFYRTNARTGKSVCAVRVDASSANEGKVPTLYYREVDMPFDAVLWLAM